MAKHDIVVLNSTSSGFETDLGNNVARVKGDADDLFSVRDSSGVNKFSVSTLDESLILNSNVTSSGNISSSLNSTASFGRVDVTNLVGDGSQMTNTNETGHVSSSAQLASRISGAFQHGFELEGENRVISGSATSTGSFTRVFSNIYVGDASDMFNVNEVGHFSGSAQLADSISGSFTRGITFQSGSSISGSATSTGSFSETIASAYSGNASQTTGVGEALATGTLSGSAQIASNVSGAFNQGFELSSKTTSISGSVTSTGSFGTMVIGNTVGLIHDISDTSELTGFSCVGLISSSAQIATSISESFTSGMQMKNSLISGSAQSTGSFTRVDSIVSISGDASEVTGVTLPSGVLSGSAQIASYVSGAFLHGFEFAGLTREENLSGSYVGVSGSAFAYAGNDTTMSISSICGSDFDYHKYDRLNGRIKGSQAFEAGGVFKTSTGLPAYRSSHTSLGTVDAALLAAGYVAPAHTDSTLKFNGVTYSNSATLNQERANAVGAGTQNSAMLNGGQSPASPYRQYVGYTEHYNGSTWSEQADSTGQELGGGGFGSQNAALRVGGLTPESSPANYPNNTELWNGTSWSSGPDKNDGDRRFFGSGGSFDAGMIVAGGTYPGQGNGDAETWDGTSWTSVATTPHRGFGMSTAGSSNASHTVGNHCQVYGGQFSQIRDGVTFRQGPNINNSRGFAGTNAAGLASCFMYAGGSSFPTAIGPIAYQTHGGCTEIYTARNLTTGSFARVNFNSVQVHCMVSSSITGFDSGHVSSSAQLASQISGAFQHGFQFDGTISASSPSTLRVHSLELSGSNTFANTQLVKNWDSSYVRTATFGINLASAISGAFNHGFSYQGMISGSATSTGSFSRIQSQELFVKEMVGVRKPISGSMNHDNYVTASYKTDSHGRITIPTFGRGHQVNTQQFSATGSMESQKYRARAGQLFVDNFGRLNMTVQTGSMVAVAGAWEVGPTTIVKNNGYAATAGVRDAFIMGGGHASSGSAIYDGIGWQRTSDVTTTGSGTRPKNCGIGTVDAAFIMRYMSGTQGGSPTGKYGPWPAAPAVHGVLMEIWDGIGWYRGSTTTNTHVKRGGTAGKVGSVNSHIAFNGDDYPTSTGTATWNGVTWQEVGPHTPTIRDAGAGFGGVYDGVVAGGFVHPAAVSCVDEWNGSTWSTATALPTALSGAGGAGPQTAGLVIGGPTYPYKKTLEYNGTSWSEETELPANMAAHGTGGTVGKAFSATTAATYLWTGGFVTGSADTHNNFSQNPTGRYLLTKNLQANYSPGTSGGVTSGSSDGYGGGY